MLHDLIYMMFLVNETQRRKELNGGCPGFKGGGNRKLVISV